MYSQIVVMKVMTMTVNRMLERDVGLMVTRDLQLRVFVLAGSVLEADLTSNPTPPSTSYDLANFFKCFNPSRNPKLIELLSGHVELT